MIDRGLLDEVRRCCRSGCAAARPPARRSATRSYSASSTTAARLVGDLDAAVGADGPGDPPLRAPPAVLVPPRSPGPLARRRLAGPARRRAAPTLELMRAAEGARHRERLRRAAGPRRRRRAHARAGARPVRPARRDRAPTECCGSSARENDPDGKEIAADGRSSSWTTAMPTARSAEMCGNGVRVFMRYLSVPASLTVMRRWRHAAGIVAVHEPRRRRRHASTWDRRSVLADRPVVTAAPLAPTRRYRGRRAMPNPHVVVEVDDGRAGRAGPQPRARWSSRRCRTGRTSNSSCGAGPRHLAHAGPRARGGRDPLLRHRHLRGRRGRATGRRRRPRRQPWRVDVPGGTLRGHLAAPTASAADRSGRARRRDSSSMTAWLARHRGPDSRWHSAVSRWTDDDRTSTTGRRSRRRHRRLRARGAPGAAARGRAVDRTRGRHRGRVPPAAPRARRAGRGVDDAARSPRRRTRSPSSPGWPRRPARWCSTG